MAIIQIGRDLETGEDISLHSDVLRTHLHLLGATGAGKTTAIKTIVRQLLLAPREKCSLFLVDPMGGLSRELLLWIANERYCPEHVRRRLVYFEPARDESVLPFNPLLHGSEEQLYFQVGRAVEIVLRAWESQNISEMPRLRRWIFASFFSAASLGFPISSCRWLLQPGTAEHVAFMERLPRDLQAMWTEILTARGSEAIKLLESTRNRLAPFFESGILRRMFGSVENSFDVRRFILDRKIVIVNLKSFGRLDSHIADAIGGFIVNEVLQSAMNMKPSEVDPTYLLLDEFQHFVGPDLFDAIPVVRQLGLRLILAHQSFSQLVKGDLDLTNIIWQARSRLMFANDAEDADIIANELATLTFDPMKLKDVLYSKRQRIVGHRREWVESMTSTTTDSESNDETESRSETEREGKSISEKSLHGSKSEGRDSGISRGNSRRQAHSSGSSHGRSETLVPIHEDFVEVASKTFQSFDEHRLEFAKRIRLKPTGHAFAKFRDDTRIRDVAIEHTPLIVTDRLEQRLEELLSQNFSADVFRSKADAEREDEVLRQRLFEKPRIELRSQTDAADSVTPKPDQAPDGTKTRGKRFS